jgi:phospholipase C
MTLPPVSGTGGTILPNPATSNSNPYVPTNSPPIGDLMDMFNFSQPPAL